MIHTAIISFIYITDANTDSKFILHEMITNDVTNDVRNKTKLCIFVLRFDCFISPPTVGIKSERISID